MQTDKIPVRTAAHYLKVNVPDLLDLIQQGKLEADLDGDLIVPDDDDIFQLFDPNTSDLWIHTDHLIERCLELHPLGEPTEAETERQAIQAEQIQAEYQDEAKKLEQWLADYDWDVDKLVRAIPTAQRSEFTERILHKLIQGEPDPRLLRVQETLIKHDALKEAMALMVCGDTYAIFQCTSATCRTEHALAISCNREYCPTCGEMDSPLHRRRKSRLYPRLLWIETMGYAVFTIPKDLAHKAMSKDAIKALRKAAWETIKTVLDAPGAILAHHLLGDEGTDYHPHFNALFPCQGYLPAETLECLRVEWEKRARKIVGEFADRSNVYYSYHTTQAEIMHKIRYVTRPIVTADKFCEMPYELREFVLSLKGFRNFTGYGKLADAQYRKWFAENGIDIEAILKEKLELKEQDGNCAVCGSKLAFMSVGTIKLAEWQEVRSGFYQRATCTPRSP